MTAWGRGNIATVTLWQATWVLGSLNLATQQHNDQPKAAPTLSCPPGSHVLTGSVPQAWSFLYRATFLIPEQLHADSILPTLSEKTEAQRKM